MRVRILLLALSLLLAISAASAENQKRFRVSIDFPGIAQKRVATLKDVWGSYLSFSESVGSSDSKFQDVPPGDFNLRVEFHSGHYAVKSFRVNATTAARNGQVEVTVRPADLRASANSLNNAHTVDVNEIDIPREATEHFREAWKEMHIANWRKAQGHFQAAIAAAPAYFDAWNNLGVVFRKLDEVPAAEDAFRKALALRPDSFEASLNLAEILASRGAYDEAIRHARHAHRLRPMDPHSNAQLGAHLFHAGKFEECIPYLLRAAEEDPKSFYFPQLLLAAAYEKLGSRTAAVEQLEYWLRHHPDNPDRNVVQAKLSQLTVTIATESEATAQ